SPLRHQHSFPTRRSSDLVELLAWRKARGHPWHSPPHRPNFGHLRFHITAACFEHESYIGHSPARMDAFARDLLAVFAARASQTRSEEHTSELQSRFDLVC